MPVRQRAEAHTVYLREQDAQLDAIIREAKFRAPEHTGAAGDVRTAIERIARDLHPALIGLSHDVHAHPELCFAEHHAVGAVSAFLRERGCEVTEGAFGLDTAMESRVGAAGPTVVIMAEYDALPGIGHACGHNLICAIAVGAFLATAAVTGLTGGQVLLLGTPAEEGGGGKELMARAGAFDGVDAAIMVHPSTRDCATYPFMGMRSVRVDFRGEAAHASFSPYMGRNALDAAVTAYTGISQLRQHILPGDRLHGVITNGGAAPNIVPAEASMEFMLRSERVDSLLHLSRRAEEVFEAAAAMAATDAIITWDPHPAYLPMRHNHTLASRYWLHLEERGRAVVPPGVIPSRPTGSTDAGNVSVRVPTIHPFLEVAPLSVFGHHPDFADHAVSERADAAIVDGVIGLALTAADFLCDERLRADVGTEFDAAGGPVDVESLLA